MKLRYIPLDWGETIDDANLHEYAISNDITDTFSWNLSKFYLE